ncbi:hypothetical protein ISN45_At03g052730 [Arabidopsis thaliana x Arabidopsis arenosa]|uniref:Uncharacterized protein n=2 Tax=Arabidopsis TaxID=3701 RepID=A0A178VJC5_ARATH|nr:hypothetical protein ISN45_At03g052730 [Arabidopsis thaliana x Arabidopsis arenosa]OAP05571.1 hypothetical protein AXX17_AT3G54090 [Arabidopsis thaliana]
MKRISIFFSISWLSLSLNYSLTQSFFVFFCFMQDSKASPARKPWYQRAMAVARFATNWRTIPKSSSQQPENFRPSRNPSVNSKSSNHNQIYHQLRKCSSLKVAANSFTRVCLCAPIGPYDDVFRNHVPPRRSSSYPPSKPLPMETAVAVATARMSVDSGRRIFRGKSLRENALMRRFVVAEEEAIMENRKRDQMEIVRKRNQMRRKKKLGPSPLSRMVIAEDQEVCLL